MKFDSFFWTWYVIALLLTVYLLLQNFYLGVFFSLLVIGIGIPKVFDEHRRKDFKKIKVNSKLLEKLKGK
jgi:hypothetical protein